MRIYDRTNSGISLSSVPSLVTEVDKLQISRHIAQLHLWKAFRIDDHYQIMHIKIIFKTGEALAQLVA